MSEQPTDKGGRAEGALPPPPAHERIDHQRIGEALLTDDGRITETPQAKTVAIQALAERMRSSTPELVLAAMGLVVGNDMAAHLGNGRYVLAPHNERYPSMGADVLHVDELDPAHPPHAADRVVRMDTPEAETLIRMIAVSDLMGSWSYGSNNNVRVLALQQAAQEEFGLTEVLNWQMDSKTHFAVELELDYNRDALRDFLRTQYQMTQEVLAARGITDVTSYRALSWPEGAVQPDWAAAQNVGNTVEVRQRPLASWSADRQVVADWLEQRRGSGVILVARMPARDILSIPTTGMGYLAQKEWVALPGNNRATLDGVFSGTASTVTVEQTAASSVSLGAPALDNAAEDPAQAQPSASQETGGRWRPVPITQQLDPADPLDSRITRILNGEEAVPPWWPKDDSGYAITKRDLEFLGISPIQIKWVLTGEAPMGMTPELYRQFGTEMVKALERDGIDPSHVDIRLKGTGAGIFSGIHKTLPREDDLVDNPQAVQRLREWFGGDQNRPLRRPYDAMWRLGLESEPSDFDLDINSTAIVRAARTYWRAHHPDRYPGDFMGGHGYVDKHTAMGTLPALAEWASKWEQKLGRPLSPGVFESTGPFDATVLGRQLSSHFKNTDWVIHAPDTPMAWRTPRSRITDPAPPGTRRADSVDHEAEGQQQAGLSEEATTAPDVRDENAPTATAPSLAVDSEPPTAEVTPVSSPGTEEEPPAQDSPAAAVPDSAVPQAAPVPDAVERSGPARTGGDVDLVGVLPMTDDEFAILYAASKGLVAAGHGADATGWDTSVFVLGRSDDQAGVLADADTVERLVADGALRYGAMMSVEATSSGRHRIAVLLQDRDEPAVGDRVLLPATGQVGIVCGYKTSELGARWADVVCDRDGWPQGWDTSVSARFLTILEPGVMSAEAATELYRVAAQREQVPGRQEAAEFGADTKPQGLAGTAPSSVPAAAEQTALFDEPDNVPRADPQGDAASGPAPANDAAQPADAAEATPGGQAAEPDTAGAAESKPRAVDDSAPSEEEAAPEADVSKREDRDQVAVLSPEPADASIAEAARQAVELPGEPEASLAPTITPEPTPVLPDPSDVPIEPAGEPPWEAVEQYARTGRIPPRFESLEAWLGGAAEEARNQREEYLEALVADEADRQQSEPPSPAPVEPPRPAPAEPPHEEPADLPSADGTTTDRPPLSREKPMTVQPEEAARASRPDPATEPLGPPPDDVFPWWIGFESANPIEPPDLDAAGAALWEAFDDHVPDEQATADEMWESVKPFLDFPTPEDAEEWRAAESAPPVDHPDGAEPRRPAPDRQEAAEALNEAMAGAERHEDVRSLPEWQKLQTVRGAAGQVWNVLREKAGAYFEQLRDDVRVQGFMRTLSVRACEAIARVAQAAADRLRAGATTQELPSAEALLQVSKAALTYSNPQHQSPEAAQAAQPANEVRDRQVLTAYASREDAVSASREIALQFHTWTTTPMGQELASSAHPLVSDFRQSWQQLPTADLPDGPGPAAGPYGAVAERANAVVKKALEQQGRFAQADVAVLKTLADLAAVHGGRLAVTLPPGVTQTAVPHQMAPAPSVAAPSTAAAKRPRASL